MPFKRKGQSDAPEDAPASASQESSFQDSEESDLSAFADYSGAPAPASDPAAPSWGLDAFAPYRPAGADGQFAESQFQADNGAAEITQPIEPSSLYETTQPLTFDHFSFENAAPATPAETNQADPPAPLEMTGMPPLMPSFGEMDTYSAFSAPDVGFADAPPTPARLIVRLGKFSASYEADRPEMLIGRPDPDNEVFPEIAIEWDDAVSRRHARILHRSDGDFVEDLDSTNGTKLNGVALTAFYPQPLTNGDLIHLGLQTEIAYYK